MGVDTRVGEARARVKVARKRRGARGTRSAARPLPRACPLYEKMNIARKASAAIHMSGLISRTLPQAIMHTT